MTSELHENRLSKGWLATWLVASLAWATTIVMLLAIPTDPKNRQIIGFSLTRIALLGTAFFLFVVFLGLAWLAYKRPKWRQRFLDPLLIQDRLFYTATIGLIVVALSLWFGAFRYNNYSHPFRVVARYAAYYERLFPFIVGLFFVCLTLALGLIILRNGIHFSALRRERPLWLFTAVCLGILLIIGLFMLFTGIGLKPDSVGWGSPGVPLLFYQVLLAWFAGLAFLGLLLLPNRSLKPWQTVLMDLVLCVALWAAAVSVWSSQDVQRSYFAPSPTAPNNEVYPYSDAGFYDYTAQSLLLGYGFLNGEVVPRPLYILFLAIFHAIVGQGYEQTIYIQTLLLATLPVFLYLLGKTLHSRGLGLTLGILGILREMNSIVSTPWVEVSHSKLFMADLPTTVAIIALAWLSVRWLIHSKRNWPDAFLVGGVLGIAALLRTQSILLAPAILMASLWVYWRQWKRYLLTTLLLLLGLALVISPWLARNWVKTGRLVFDDPTTQSALVAQRYSTELGAMPTRNPGEDAGEYASRLSASVRQYMLRNPGGVARFVTAHSLNNLVSTVLVLPMRFSIDQACDTFIVCTPFWISLVDHFTFGDAVLLILNLLIVSFGIACSWRRWKAAGIIPLIFLLVYSLSNGLARNSARRYILPVDWVSYLYLAIGLFEFAIWVAVLLGAQREKIQTVLAQPEINPQSPKPSVAWIKIGSTGIVLLLVGLSLPLAEVFRPPEFQAETTEQIISSTLNTPLLNNLSVSTQAIQAFSEQDQAVALKGRAFYPRFYAPLDGEPGSGWPAYQPYEYRATGKVGFILIGPQGATQVNIALDNPPNYFPNAKDMLVIGCQENNYVDALLVAYLDGSKQVILRSPVDRLSCPLK